jgi:hypothetical protein
LNLPDLNYQPFPIDLAHIAQGQRNNQTLLQQRMLHPLLYPSQYFNGLELISYQPTPTAPWQICIPMNQLNVLVLWFHAVLGHCRIHRLCNSIATHFLHPKLRATINAVIMHCHACQIKKQTGPGYGHLPPRDATALPLQRTATK